MIIDCIRHGATASNLANRFTASLDEALTSEEEARLRVIRFDGSSYDQIFVSPLRRCVQTAECLGLGEWITEPRIAERGLGVFAGLTSDECASRHREAFEAFLAFDADYTIPEGESRGGHLARVLSWLEQIAQCKAARVLAITHGGTIDFLYRMAMAQPIHGGDEIFGGSNATLSRFEVEYPVIRLITFAASLESPIA
jgi:broad specificity phosphatase PhoE